MFERGKKEGIDMPAGSSVREEQPRSVPREAPRATAGATAREAAVIGPSIHIDGDLHGEEDLIIQGEVKGTVQLKSNRLTIGSQGKVRADLYAKSIYVDGSIEGDVYASEHVNIRKNAEVRGNIVSPRVSLEDGAKFKGSVDMDTQAVESALGPVRAQANPAPAKAAAASPSKGENRESKSAATAAEPKQGTLG